MFRVVPFVFSLEKSTPAGKKYTSGAGGAGEKLQLCTGQLERGSNSVVEALFSCCKAVLKQGILKSNIRCHLDMRFYLFWGHLLLLLLWPITAYQPGWSRPLLGGFPGLTKYQDFR